MHPPANVGLLRPPRPSAKRLLGILEHHCEASRVQRPHLRSADVIREDIFYIVRLRFVIKRNSHSWRRTWRRLGRESWNWTASCTGRPSSDARAPVMFNWKSSCLVAIPLYARFVEDVCQSRSSTPSSAFPRSHLFPPDNIAGGTTNTYRRCIHGHSAEIVGKNMNHEYNTYGHFSVVAVHRAASTQGARSA